MSYQAEPAVKQGQIWGDADYRRPERTFKVVRNPRNSEVVTIRDTETGRISFVQRSRFNGSTRGYTFVR